MEEKNYIFTNEDKKIKVNLYLKRVDKKWKEYEFLRRIFGVGYKFAEGEDINFFMPIIQNFYGKEFKENREYSFSIEPSNKHGVEPDLLISSKFGTAGIEMTEIFSSENEKGSEKIQTKWRQKGKLKKTLSKKEGLMNTDSVSEQIVVKNNIESLLERMKRRIKIKERKIYKKAEKEEVKDIKNMALLINLQEEFSTIVYGPGENGCYQSVEGEKLYDYFHVLYYREIAETLYNFEIRKFKFLVVLITSPFSEKPSFCFAFRITGDKIENGIKNYLKKEEEEFEKRWKCKINSFMLQYLAPIMICTATKVDWRDYEK